MVASLALGLLGSLGHCVGMCSAVVILLDRQLIFKNRFSWILVHAGRVTTYAVFGLLAGTLGQTLWSFQKLQAALSLLFAFTAFYMASTLIGLTPSPERFLAAWTHRWGRSIRSFHGASPLSPYLLGLLWGLLPCGLVLTALIAAVASASAFRGAWIMLLFGIATIPSLLAVKWLSTVSRTWSRSLASVAMMLFGFQFAMRGFASLGLVDHLMLGSLSLW